MQAAVSRAARTLARPAVSRGVAVSSARRWGGLNGGAEGEVGAGRVALRSALGGLRRGMSTGQGDDKEEWRVEWAVKENKLGERYKWLLSAMGFYSEDAKSERAASLLYVSARKQAARKEFTQYLGVKEDFSTRFYLECLHVWMLLVRLRREGEASKQIRQDVFDRFWQDITKQIHALGVKPIALSARVRELQNAFYGAAIAYDYSLGTSDAILASALYRNVYGHDCKARHLLMLTAYVRRELDAIDNMDLEQFLDANWSFGNPHDTH